MKKGMKWVVANEPVTAQDLVAVALLGMLLGAVITWFVFALFWGYRVFEDAGSAADWAAAVGTAIVGYGAWKYAREAHKQRAFEIERALLLSRAQQNAQVFLMQGWAAALREPLRILDILKEIGADVSVGAYLGMIDGAERNVLPIDFTDPCWMLLGGDGMKLKLRINRQILTFGTSAKWFRERHIDHATLLRTTPFKDRKYCDLGVERFAELADELDKLIDNYQQV